MDVFIGRVISQGEADAYEDEGGIDAGALLDWTLITELTKDSCIHQLRAMMIKDMREVDELEVLDCEVIITRDQDGTTTGKFVFQVVDVDGDKDETEAHFSVVHKLI